MASLAPQCKLRNMSCIVCGGNASREHIFREMMFGLRKEFGYSECLYCGCLQISTVPDNMSEYYPQGYYSFSTHASALQILHYRAHFMAPRFMRQLRRCSPDRASVIAAQPKPDARILDVGSGSGQLVEILRAVGFDAHGIDPFLDSDLPYVRRSSLEEVEGGWDLIMFHHSLEHMRNHIEVLRIARSKLALGGTCLVRIPIANWAWKHYGGNWVQLDPPRHLVIHTLTSFRMTVEAAGFQITRIIFDSQDLQFRGSELYRRNVALADERARNYFSSREIRHFRDRADKLNEKDLGDQAAFFLTAS
jgi:SAM-dependent methyltransferase